MPVVLSVGTCHLVSSFLIHRCSSVVVITHGYLSVSEILHVKDAQIPLFLKNQFCFSVANRSLTGIAQSV